jgi:anti-sigma factor RsiW
MHDSWIEKLSDHIDGTLSDADTRELAAHLEACADCRSIEEELRAVVSAAHAAPMQEPERDLWSGIAARIEGSVPGVIPAADATAARLIPDRSAVDGRATKRRFSFSMPQLAAAAVLIMAVSGTAVWLVTDSANSPEVSTGTIVQSAGDAPRSTRPVSTVAPPADYVDDVAALEQALEQNSAQLDPVTIDVIQRSLEAINDAIDDARAALEADPGNPYLHRQLDNTMRKKIDVLRRATGA